MTLVKNHRKIRNRWPALNNRPSSVQKKLFLMPTKNNDVKTNIQQSDTQGTTFLELFRLNLKNRFMNATFQLFLTSYTIATCWLI